MRALLLALIVCLAGAALAAPPAFTEEFVGPFPSWKNVKTDYGAKGDGIADDTAAIQHALDELRFHQDHCVLYFPAGTYRVTRTVGTKRAAHHECLGITVVGEDPATTILQWDGPEGGTVFKYDAWYAKISRLTLDGRGKAAVALAYGDAFSTYNETSDMIFTDVQVGMSMATAGHGQAENAVLRCTFRRCSTAGIRTNNYNSLDIWAWYCTFEDCGYGLYNGAGNFHAYQCLFLRSTTADIGTANLMTFSFVNNTSIGSRCFLDFQSGHSWGSSTTISGNRVIEPTGEWALRLGNGGPYLVMDNVFKARPDAKAPYVGMTWGDQTFVGNTYTLENPVKEAGRFYRLDEKVADPKTIDATPPVMPPTPPRRERAVYEVPRGADAATIQAAIDEAAKRQGRRPVIHLPMGIYQINRTLTVPAGLDLQLIGDGGSENSTVLRWTGPAGAPLLLLEGPSVAVVRDLAIQTGAATGLKITNGDQPGGKIFADQLNVPGTSPAATPVGLLVNGIEESDVQLRCLQGGAFCAAWVKVVGGAKRAAGQDAPGQLSVLCGATGSADLQYVVERGGRLVVRGVYHEMSGDAPQAILLNDRGILNVDATRFSYKTAPDRPLVKADGFRGQFALLSGLLLPVNSAHTARVEIAGDGAQAKLLVMNNIFWANEQGATADKIFLNAANPPAAAAFLYNNKNGNQPDLKNGFAHLDNTAAPDPAFLRALLAPTRDTAIWLPQETPPGVTNLQLHRLMITAGKEGVGVEMTAGKE
ncbi:MAG TPA: glycosyl hydrolase family 28-related protein [Armatimonadota bacterium]|nr:glycosyl hydrolase family 28-related protein [Armatimonadota bacterium]